MDATELLEKISDSLTSTASVKSVFGEPIRAEGKTIVPVAKVAYGFGAGSGAGTGDHSGNGARQGEGGGGGGGVRAFPAGALEITRDSTRFIRCTDMRLLAGAFAAGALLSRLVFRRRS